MNCQYCQSGMGTEGDGEYCCDDCGATFDSHDQTWTPPTIHFEDEYPEEAAILADICKERAEQKAKGKRQKPMFLDAEPVTAGQKIGRNEPCPCGSGRKYKKCCIR